MAGLAPGISCAPAAPLSLRPGEKRVVIFHSNDVHAKIDHFAKIAVILDRERRSGADVFYFSAGDNFTGNPVVDRYNPPGGPIREIYNRLGLTLLELGNHEFDYGWERLDRYLPGRPVRPSEPMSSRLRALSPSFGLRSSWRRKPA